MSRNYETDHMNAHTCPDGHIRYTFPCDVCSPPKPKRKRKPKDHKILARLKRHDQLMRQFMAKGMTRVAASEKAFNIVTGKDKA